MLPLHHLLFCSYNTSTLALQAVQKWAEISHIRIFFPVYPLEQSLGKHPLQKMWHLSCLVAQNELMEFEYLP